MSDDKKTNQESPKNPLADASFWLGAASGLLVLILGFVIEHKLANTNITLDITAEGFKLGLIFIANYIAAYAPILGIVGIVFNAIGLKFKTKLVQILNYAIISIVFLELLLLFGI